MKLEESDFSYFKERCLYYGKLLGINAWMISFGWHERNTKRGMCVFNNKTLCVDVLLNRTWSTPITKPNLDSVARHEMIHVYLRGFINVFKGSYSKEEKSELEEVLVADLTRILKKISSLTTT